MAHGHVGGPDLASDVGPDAQDGPAGDAGGAGTGLEQLEHALAAVDTGDPARSRNQAQAGGATAHAHVEH